jgi:hypothetical protein
MVLMCNGLELLFVSIQSSPLSVNGNSASMESDGSTHVSAATNTSHPKTSLSGGLISAAPLIMMAPCSPQLP